MTEQTLSVFRTEAGAAAYRAAYEKTLALWPDGIQSFDVQTSFGCTYFNALGDPAAPPLILLHGTGLSSTQWYLNVGALAKRFRVFAPDIPDQAGLSSRDRIIQTRENYELWMTELLNGLGLQRAHLAGLSYGGWIAANFAIAHPERVSRLALLSPAGTFVPLTMKYLPHVVFMMLGSALNIDWPFYNLLRWSATIRPIVGMPVMDQFVIGYKAAIPVRVGNPVVFEPQEFARLTMPALLLIGDHDENSQKNAQDVIEEARRLLPGIQTELIPDAAHFLTIDQPEAVNRALLAFFCASGK